MGEEKFKRIDDLQRKMYSREMEGVRGVREHTLREHASDVETSWGDNPLPKQAPVIPRSKYLKWLLRSSLGFFALALLYIGYLSFGGSYTVSSQNILIAVTGPVSTKGGEPLSLQISVTNSNATPLEAADLLVEFPDGTRDASDLSRALPRARSGLGDIPSGERVTRTISAALFGEEHSSQIIKVTVEYRLPGSNAIFYKESEYPIVISSTPLSIVVEAPDEATSGQTTELSVKITSNATEVIQGVSLSAEYPSGFSFTSSNPEPSSGGNAWMLGDIAPGSSRTFRIRGTLVGEDADVRIFRFTVGIARSSTDPTIETPFGTISEQVALAKPFVGLSILVNGSNADQVPVKSGKPVRVTATYTNNLSVPVSDVKIGFVLEGDALDKSSVIVEKGFYRSIDNTVLWDKSTLPSLGNLLPGQSGSVSLTLSSRSLSQGIATLPNPTIAIYGSVKGTRAEGGNVPGEIIGSIKKTIQVDSDVSLSARVLHYSGPFTNSGPMPPKVERETTYTVVWTVTNGSNAIDNAVVSATLPSYVQFVTPNPNESVVFNGTTGTVTWNAGSIKAGAGFGNAPREASFQISFLPSLSQVGSNPILIGDITVSAADTFTKSKILVTRPALDTRLSSDPGAKQGDETVIK